MNDDEIRNAKFADEQKSKAALAAKERVVEEAQDLKAKADRLEAFINGPAYHDVSDDHKGLLRAQLSHMRAYWQTLQLRLKAWG